MLKGFIFWIVSIVLFVFSVINSTLPNGEHIIIASGIREANGGLSKFTSKQVSRIKINAQGTLCNISLRENDHLALFKQSAPVEAVPGILVIFIAYEDDVIRGDLDYFSNFFHKTLKKCNVEAKTARYSMSPIFLSILAQNPEYVSALIANGANLQVTLAQPGKVTDGMSPKDFALHLYKKKNSENAKKIVKLLEEKRLSDE